jgi:hypothetical protein
MAESMFDEDTPSGSLMDSESKMISYPAGRAMQALSFSLNGPQFIVDTQLVLVAVPTVSQSLRALFNETLSVPPQGTQGAAKALCNSGGSLRMVQNPKPLACP